jgi:hypothetical protein
MSVANPREVGPFGHFGTKQYLRPDDWREEFLGPARQLEGAIEILRLFGLDRIYGEGNMPGSCFALMDGV